MRIVVARCQVDYAGRLTAHLPMATRVLMIKADGSVLVHSDGGSYKPLNWMSPPCTFREGTTEDGQPEWTVTAGKTDDTLRILIEEVHSDSRHELGVDPGLQKDGVEKHLQELLAEHPASLAEGLTLVRREFMTAIGPVDLMCRDADGLSVAVEIKRRGEIDGVEQLTRYLDLLNRDPALTRKGAVRGIFAAQEIKPQARVLATDRGIACALVDYDALRGMDDSAAPAVLMDRPDGRAIFHVATAADWAAAQATGAYTTSTHGRTLAEEGFIHASRPEQVQPVLDRWYADVAEPLVLLVVDPDGSPPRCASSRSATTPIRTSSAPSTRPPWWRCTRSTPTTAGISRATSGSDAPGGRWSRTSGDLHPAHGDETLQVAPGAHPRQPDPLPHVGGRLGLHPAPQTLHDELHRLLRQPLGQGARGRRRRPDRTEHPVHVRLPPGLLGAPGQARRASATWRSRSTRSAEEKGFTR